MESEFPGNAHSQKSSKTPETKTVKKVVQGEVIVRKKGLYKRFTETFTGDDTQGVGSYVLFDVMIPAFKDMVFDAVSQGVERKLFGGDSRGSSRRGGYRPGGSSGYTPYSRYSTGGGRTNDPRPPMSREARANHRFNENVIPSRGEATMVLDQMIEILEEYEVVTVKDFLLSIGETPTYMDEKYGWFDLNPCEIRRVRDGFIVQLPRPQPID